MRPIILGYFSNNYDGNKDISIKDPPGPRGAIFYFSSLNVKKGGFQLPPLDHGGPEMKSTYFHLNCSKNKKPKMIGRMP